MAAAVIRAARLRDLCSSRVCCTVLHCFATVPTMIPHRGRVGMGTRYVIYVTHLARCVSHKTMHRHCIRNLAPSIDIISSVADPAASSMRNHRLRRILRDWTGTAASYIVLANEALFNTFLLYALTGYVSRDGSMHDLGHCFNVQVSLTIQRSK